MIDTLLSHLLLVIKPELCNPCEPLSYLEFIYLLKNAKVVITDGVAFRRRPWSWEFLALPFAQTQSVQKL
jgi:hypothetical protein